MRSSRVLQNLMLGSVLARPSLLATLKLEDFDEDLRLVLCDLTDRLATRGEQKAGRAWAKGLGIDWDKPLVEQLAPAIAADCEQKRQDAIMHQLQLLRHRPRNGTWDKLHAELVSQLKART